MKYPIHDIKGEVLFEAEIECDGAAIDSHKERLAVLWAVSNEQSMAEADLSRARLSGVDLKGADLQGADLNVADLRFANLSGANLQGADLRYTGFRNADLRYADLHGADLHGADLIDADLSDADLSDADLSGADLKGAILYDADLEGTILPNRDVRIENIHQKVYEAASQPGALDMGDWHTCDTTHCRAGWVVHLAGKAGYELEKNHGTVAAALMIYQASDPDYRETPDFFASHEKTLADMKRLAAQERIQ